MNRSAPPQFEFRPGESVRRGILRLAGLLPAHARARLAAPPTQLAQTVHETRVLLKRARALLRLLTPGLPADAARLKAAEARLRRAARRLAPARDGEVGLVTLTRLVRDASATDRSHLEPVRHWFATHHRDRPLRAGALLRSLHQVPALLDQTVRTLQTARWPDHGWRVLEASFHDSYRRARRRLKNAAREGKAAAFHDARTGVKRLMYQIQLLRRVSPRLAARLARTLDDLQTNLGDDHDLAVLDAALRKAPPRLGEAKSRKRLHAAIAQRQRKLRRRALRLARQSFAARPASFTAALHHDWRRGRKKA